VKQLLIASVLLITGCQVFGVKHTPIPSTTPVRQSVTDALSSAKQAKASLEAAGKTNTKQAASIDAAIQILNSIK